MQFDATVKILSLFPTAPWAVPCGYSSGGITFRWRREPHSLLAAYLNLAITGMRALHPSREVPTTWVRLRISRLSRSMALLALILRRCLRGNLVYVSVSTQVIASRIVV